MTQIGGRNHEQLVTEDVRFERAIERNDHVLHAANVVRNPDQVLNRSLGKRNEQEWLLHGPKAKPVVIIGNCEIRLVFVVDFDGRVVLVLLIQRLDCLALALLTIAIPLLDVIVDLALTVWLVETMLIGDEPDPE